eukprot:728395_1
MVFASINENAQRNMASDSDSDDSDFANFLNFSKAGSTVQIKKSTLTQMPIPKSVPIGDDGSSSSGSSDSSGFMNFMAFASAPKGTNALVAPKKKSPSTTTLTGIPMQVVAKKPVEASDDSSTDDSDFDDFLSFVKNETSEPRGDARVQGAPGSQGC